VATYTPLVENRLYLCAEIHTLLVATAYQQNQRYWKNGFVPNAVSPLNHMSVGSDKEI
jgi:hypothetical protein